MWNCGRYECVLWGLDFVEITGNTWVIWAQSTIHCWEEDSLDPLMLCYVIHQFGVRDDDNDDLWHRIDKQSAENSANTVELTNGLFQKKLNRSVFIMSALRPTMQWQEAAQRKAAECKWNKLPVNGCEHKIIGWSLFWSKHGCWRWKLFLALLLVWWKVLRSWYQHWR